MGKVIKKQCEKCFLLVREVYKIKTDKGIRFMCYHCVLKETGSRPATRLNRVRNL